MTTTRNARMPAPAKDRQLKVDFGFGLLLTVQKHARNLFEIELVKSTDRQAIRTRLSILWNSPTSQQKPIAAIAVNCQPPVNQGIDQ